MDGSIDGWEFTWMGVYMDGSIHRWEYTWVGVYIGGSIHGWEHIIDKINDVFSVSKFCF